ncbi:CoA-transferase, partial [Clostridium homopropionicum]|uniref:CoA-transferase n=1 Tax=Clostridium homopropionicum TaxID=36844 RepID=UPI00311A4DDD
MARVLVQHYLKWRYRYMEKIKNIEEALEYAKDNMSIMIGGFLGVGTPETLINGLIKKGVKNLTIISND